MTIDEAVLLLRALATRHGGDTQVYFDCPHCLTSFAPSKLETQAVHLKQAGTADDAPKSRVRP